MLTGGPRFEPRFEEFVKRRHYRNYIPSGLVSFEIVVVDAFGAGREGAGAETGGEDRG